jgi:hypothetical protein
VIEIRDEEAELDRVLATVLFTDIVGSTEKAADRSRTMTRDSGGSGTTIGVPGLAWVTPW